jgi:hypothetical protein
LGETPSSLSLPAVHRRLIKITNLKGTGIMDLAPGPRDKFVEIAPENCIPDGICIRKLSLESRQRSSPFYLF